jgi:hypothetical protein
MTDQAARSSSVGACQRRRLALFVLSGIAALTCSGRSAATSAPSEVESGAGSGASAPAAACEAAGAAVPFQRLVDGAHRGCTVDADCATVKLDCSHLNCTAVQRDHASRYAVPIDCTGYTGGLGNYDCDPQFDIEAPRCHDGCCVSVRILDGGQAVAAPLPDHCFAPEVPSAGPAVGDPIEEPTPADEPEAMPDGVPPDDDPAAAASWEDCRARNAAGCALAARAVFESGGDEVRGRQLARRAADLEWLSLTDAGTVSAPTVQEPRDVVAAFRRGFLGDVVPALGDRPDSEQLRTFAECMAGDAQFIVTRTPRRAAYRTLAFDRLFFPEAVLQGGPESLAGPGWVWQVVFTGASRRFPPSGAIAGFVDPADGRLLLAWHIPEG